MICNECFKDVRSVQVPDGLETSQVLHMCRTWACARCQRTPEQVQAEFERESRIQAANFKPAHDWAGLAARQQKHAQEPARVNAQLQHLASASEPAPRVGEAA